MIKEKVEETEKVALLPAAGIFPPLHIRPNPNFTE